MPKAALSGLNVAIATTGGMLMYFGIKDVAVIEGLRELSRGGLPAGKAPTPVVPGVTGSLDGSYNQQAIGAIAGRSHPLVAAAARYIGRPYDCAKSPKTRFGPDRFDCSGLVWRAFADNGVKLTQRTSLTQATLGHSIARNEVTAGDLCAWPGIHIGIAINSASMIEAPRCGKDVRIGPIDWKPGAVCRRIDLGLMTRELSGRPG
jgi:cell wall-associated NlpC family hydrolase